MANGEAFDDWYRRNYKTVLAAAVVCAAGDRALAEDATADAFVQALKKWDSVSAMESPVAWTATVAANRVRRLQRRRSNRRQREERTASTGVVLDGHASDSADLWDAIAALSPRQREAVVLGYVEGATQAEVAQALDIAPGTAAATLHQASTDRLRMRPRVSGFTDRRDHRRLPHRASPLCHSTLQRLRVDDLRARYAGEPSH